MASLSAIGLDFIEVVWGKDDLERLSESLGRDLRRAAERAGCPVRSAVLGTFPDAGQRLREPGARASEIDAMARACAALAAAGGEVLLLPNWAGEAPADYDALYADYLCTCGDQAGKLGVQLAVEHITSSKYRNSATQVFELVEQVDHPHVGVYFDIANGLPLGEEPVETAATIASRVKQYHVKDHPKAGRSLADMPLKAVKDTLQSAGYAGRVAIEMGPTNGDRSNAHLAAALKTLRANGY